jgi:putative hemolysin
MSTSRPNKPKIRYDRADLIEILGEMTDVNRRHRERIADAYEHHRATGADAPCQAIVYHGPGHQSSTYCQVRGGPDHHDRNSAYKVVHYADLPSGGYAEWTDDDPYAREDPW